MARDSVDAKLLHLLCTVRRRNLLEWAACALLLVGFATLAVLTQNLLAGIGSAIIVGASAWIAWRWYRDGRIQLRPGATRADLAREIERQAELVRSAGLWHTAPIAVGLVLFGMSRGDARVTAASVVTALAVVLVMRRSYGRRAVAIRSERGDPAGEIATLRMIIGFVVFAAIMAPLLWARFAG